MIQVLCRRRKNNPVLVGDPGVGKTAIVEGLALAVHERRVPLILRDATIYSLDMGAPPRRHQVPRRVRAAPEGRDQGHRGRQGAPSCSSTRSTPSSAPAPPAAARWTPPTCSSRPSAAGDLRCIGSTTFPEYKSSFERDRALARRFQKIEVLEPSIDETVKILAGLRGRYEEHHRRALHRRGLKAAGRAVGRNTINDRFLPTRPSTSSTRRAVRGVHMIDPRKARAGARGPARDRDGGGAGIARIPDRRSRCVYRGRAGQAGLRSRG
jgi:ATP-dependent Clp protease ATP-binding subunit ClpA